MKIREIMRPACSVGTDDTLWRAERLMSRRHIKQLTVLDAGKLAGVLSERDLLAYRSRNPDAEWWLAPVRRAMRTVPVTSGPDEPAGVAGERIAASPDGLLPVVEHGRLLGVVTATDLLDAELRAWTPNAAEVTAGDVMTEGPFTVTPADTLVDAMRLMSEHPIRHLPVVDNGEVVGMLSERDLLPVADELSINIARREDARLLRVRDAMTMSATTVTADTPLAVVSRTLVDQRIGAVPVVDAQHRPIGIVSYVDILRALA